MFFLHVVSSWSRRAELGGSGPKLGAVAAPISEPELGEAAIGFHRLVAAAVIIELELGAAIAAAISWASWSWRRR